MTTIEKARKQLKKIIDTLEKRIDSLEERDEEVGVASDELTNIRMLRYALYTEYELYEGF